VICNKIHPRSGKTCSDICYKALLSTSIKHAISNGFDPKKNRGRGKKSYLETSFEEWLNKNFPNIGYIPEYPVKRQDMLKTYFGDFYFPSKNLIIELDGTQHNDTTEYDQERDTYITQTYGITIFRISHKEYVGKTKLDKVIQLLSCI
jgi:very-short-patch-repair endonuclease